MENHRLHTLLWIVRQLEESPKSLSELNERWIRDEGLSGGLPIERRTFLNYIHAIDDMLHISIECDRKDKYRYFIASRERSSLNRWMQENFRQQLALGRGLSLSHRIMVEEAPQGQEYLEQIVEAMTGSQQICFTYKEFNSDESMEICGAPYALRCYQQRWYVVVSLDLEEMGVEDVHEEDIIVPYPLDRILSLVVQDKTFVMPETFSVETYFQYSFGTRVMHDEDPIDLMLKVNARQCDYIRKLPLHHSQQEVETQRNYSIFRLRVYPTVELTMKILSMGYLVEVLAPKCYRAIISEEAERLYRTYFNHY